MSENRVEVNSDNTNVSLEEQAKQQENVIAEGNENRVELDTDAKPTESRPEWLPEKFKSAEDLAKAYSELEKKQSAPTEEAPTEQVAEGNEQTDGIDKYYDEYSETGEISEKSYGELSKMGLSKELVDGYIAGQKAIADQDVKAVHDTVGGQENYAKVLEWSAQNLTDAEKEAFNSTLDNGSLEQVKLAVSAIAGRAGVSATEQPQMIEGDTNPSNPEVFESVAQVTEAMNNPKYEKDPAYRKQVEEKLAKSSVF